MKSKGFTLIELMIVVAILGILAAIAIPAFSGSSNTSYGVNGVVGQRCVDGYLFVVGGDGSARQVIDANGRSAPCNHHFQ